jgi:hypothetical protein
MGWVFWASDVPVQSDGSDDTIANGAPYEAYPAAGSRTIQAPAPAVGGDGGVAEEIRRRQLRLLERYVTSVRLR